MVSQTEENIEFTSTEATIIEIVINEINNQDTVKRSSFMRIQLKTSNKDICSERTKTEIYTVK